MSLNWHDFVRNSHSSNNEIVNILLLYFHVFLGVCSNGGLYSITVFRLVFVNCACEFFSLHKVTPCNVPVNK